MTAVTIAGTFGKNERPSNGLETIAAQLVKDQLGRHYVVGVVQFCGANVAGPNEPLVPRVKFLGIEVVTDVDADTVKELIDEGRKARGLGIVDDLPAATGELNGQGAFDFGDPDEDDEPGETRLTGDGERKVPPASGEEILAERAEAAKGSVIDATAKLAAKDKAGKNAPAASFSGGAE